MCDIIELDESIIWVIDVIGSECYVIDLFVVLGFFLKLIFFIEFDLNFGCIFFLDLVLSWVVCINFEGEVLWDIFILGGLCGLVFIDDENLLVCDQFSEKVCLFLKDGVFKFFVIFLEDGFCNLDFIVCKLDINDVIVLYGGFGIIGFFIVQ